MPSDSSGIYSLPTGYLAITGETILASQHNPPLEDIAAGLTARLMRSGAAPMTGALKLADGSASTPGLSFASAPTTGLFKSTLGIGVGVSGVQVMDFGSSASFIDGGDIASANALTLGTGNVFNITGTTAVTSIATKGVGTIVWLRFNGILTLTYDATNLILTTAANIITAAGDWAVFEEYAAGEWRMLNYVRASGAALVASLPRGYIDGCAISNAADATNDIATSAGTCRDSTNTVDITVPAFSTGKQLDANWAAGDAAGMRNSAVGIADGTYHLYAVRTAASPVADIYAHTSTNVATVLTALQAETGGSAYLYARRIGSIIRISASIIPFAQNGDYFRLKTPGVDYNSSTLSTSAAAVTLARVPLGLSVLVKLNITVSGSGSIVYLKATGDTDSAPDATAAPLATGGSNATTTLNSQVDVWVDTSAQFTARANQASTTLRVAPLWWRDRRGKDV